jgi:DNA-nicking Smr family endonuclease
MNAISCVHRPTKEEKERELKWQAESDVRTLAEAAAIKKDPARLKRARAMATEQLKAAQANASVVTDKK